MSYSRRQVCSWLAIVLAGCTGEPPSTSLVTAADDVNPYVGHQGRLLLGFKDPDVRTFTLAPSVVNPRVLADGQLIAAGLGGRDFVGVAVTAAGNGGTIQMRIAQVIAPALPGAKWQYVLEQHEPGTGAFTPACAEPPLLVPPAEPPATPPRAIAMPGTWSADGLYDVTGGGISFACQTGVVAKCDGWGYPVSADPPKITEHGQPTSVSGADMMQACTRMARADYCALGMPNTLDGTPIHIDDIFRSPPAVPGYAFEAAWPGVAVADRSPVRPPALCLSKLRWSTLPLGGDCPLLVPDPRVDTKGTFCDDLSAATLEQRGALVYSSSTYLDAGLYSHRDPLTDLRLTTASLVPQGVGHPPAWLIPPPAGVEFPKAGQAVQFEATIFSPVLPAELPADTLLKLFSYRCTDDLVTTTSAAPDASCQLIATEGYVYAPNLPGHAPLRRWWHPATHHSYTTAGGPTTLIGDGWQLVEVVGGVLRAALDVTVRWSAVPGATYALDVQTRTGEWISPCLNIPQIGGFTHAIYRGVCTAAAHRAVNHADITAFRIRYMTQSQIGAATQAYDGVDSDAYVDLGIGKTTAVALRWNDLGPDVTYAFEVHQSSGDWIPCAGASVLANSVSYVHTGWCPSSEVSVNIDSTTQLRVCAMKSSGGKPACAEAAYDGRRPLVTLAFP